jgi:hypothetical protein
MKMNKEDKRESEGKKILGRWQNIWNERMGGESITIKV